MKGMFSRAIAVVIVVAGIYFLPRLLPIVMQSETPAAVVISRSMWPVLNRGDIVLIKGAAKEEIQIGTILIFRHGDGIAIHRVIRLDGDTIVTKGDANPKEDDPITFDDVVGRLPTVLGHPGKIGWLGNIALWMGSADRAPSPDQPPPAPPGRFQSFRNLVSNPLGLVILVVLPTILVLTLVWMEIWQRIGPGHKKRRWRQKRLERIRRRRPRAKLAFR